MGTKMLPISTIQDLQFLNTVLLPLILLLVLFLLIHKRFFLGKASSNCRKTNLPPSPPKLPILGNIHQLGFHLHRSLWSLAEQYGKELILIHLGSTPFLIVSCANITQEIIKTHDELFCNRPITRTVEKLFYNGKDLASARYGEYWRQMRSLCVLHLLGSKTVRSFRRVREEEIDLLMQKITEKISTTSATSATEKVINLRDMLTTFTKDVICRVALGRKYSGNFVKLFLEFSTLLSGFRVGDFVPWLAWIHKLDGWDAKVDKVAKEFDQFLEQVLQEHQDRRLRVQCNNDDDDDDKEEVSDFVDVLLDIQKDNNFDQITIDKDSIKALLMDVFSGGTDTTFTLLEWTMSELLKHPKIMQELQKEVRRIAGKKSKVDEDDLEQMKYLKAVIKETLRVHPIVPLLSRLASQDVKIKGYEIPAGTGVLVNTWAIYRDPTYWEEPEKFNPERFLSSSIDFRGQDSHFLPFGAGRRMCPGILFSVTISELVLANLMHKFDWVLPGEARGETLDISEWIGVTIQRKTPLLAVATTHT